MAIPCLFAYVGPDTFMPVASALSAVAGAVMLLWNTGSRSLVRSLTARLRRGATPHSASAPSHHRRRPTPARSDASTAGSTTAATD